MRVQRISWKTDLGLAAEGDRDLDANLLIYFGNRALFADGRCLTDLAKAHPEAILFGCTSGGQISGDDISDEEVTAVAIGFAHTRIARAEVTIDSAEHSRRAGETLAAALRGPDLAGVMVLSDGLSVNGSELVAGMVAKLGRHIPICGGLAGDGAAFERTLVGIGGPPRANLIGAIGFYGENVRIGHGSAGGWEAFGPKRSITRSSGNVLYELDGQPALDLYERYLGPEDIKGLPGTALRFPLLVRNPECAGQELVRTVLSIDQDKRSMTFAGDIPRGWSAQLMRSSFERLAEGAATAGQQASAFSGPSDAAHIGGSVGILISCIGRRLMMGQHVVEEIDAVCAELPPGMAKLGFYSYGEISPHAATGFCELHNQTMTVMTIAEKAA